MNIETHVNSLKDKHEILRQALNETIGELYEHLDNGEYDRWIHSLISSLEEAHTKGKLWPMKYT